MKAFSSSSLFFLAVLNAATQVESGTLIVLNASDDEIAVAADSRSYSAAGPLDNRCKITVLGNKLIFAASGNTSYRSIDGRSMFWDAHATADSIFVELSKKATVESMPFELAREWGDEVKRQAGLYLKRDGASVVLEGTEHDTLTRAVVAGFVDDHPLIVIVSVIYRTAPSGVTFDSSITNVFDGPKAVILGREDIANELFAGQTPRAI